MAAWRQLHPSLRGTVRVALALSACAACTALPAPVITPGATRPLTPALSLGTGWGNAHSRFLAADGTIRSVVGNGDNSWGQDNPNTTAIMTIVPAAFSIQGAGVLWDGGGYLGWRRLGAGARRLVRAGPTGALTSLVFSANAEWGARAADASAALEHSPVLGPRTRGLLRLGASFGRRRYGVWVPVDLNQSSDESFDIHAPPHFELFRTDTRIEALLGFSLAGGTLTFAVQPYLVAFHGGINEVTCPHCASGTQLVDFQQDNGISFAITLQRR